MSDADDYAEILRRGPGKPSGKLEGEGTIVGKRAPDFALPDQNGKIVRLSKALRDGPALLAFYPRDFTTVCTKQLCNYRDNIGAFRQFGLQVFGISSNPSNSHAKFGTQYEFPFPLLADVDHKVAKLFDCRSLFMAGRVSRAVFVLNRDGFILYRYVEPTILTHRSAGELVQVLEDLKKNGLI